MTDSKAPLYLSVLSYFRRLINNGCCKRSMVNLDADAQLSNGHVRKRVLLIGNDPTMRALYETMFRDHIGEIDCRFAKDGIHAILGQIRRFPANFDLIVLHWNAVGGHPDLKNGHDILLSLRLLDQTRNLPVAVVHDETVVHEGEVKLHGATYCFSTTKNTEDVVRWIRIFIGVPSAKNEYL